MSKNVNKAKLAKDPVIGRILVYNLKKMDSILLQEAPSIQ